MQIVIDIPEDAYNYIKANGARIPYYKLTNAIKKGTPLPEGHGRLIDADALYDSAPLCHTEEDGTACVEWKDINDAPTIIERDGGDVE